MTGVLGLALAAAFAAGWPAARPGVCGTESVVPNRPLTLEDCTLIALRMNPTIVSSEQGVVTARAGVMQARSGYYPQLSLGLSEGLTSRQIVLSSEGETFVETTNRREDLDLFLSETFWQRGRQDQVDQSAYALQVAQHDRATTYQGLVEQVASGYYTLLATQQLVGVATDSVASAESHLEQVRALVKVGAAADVDVYPAEDDLARAQLDLIDARSNVQVTKAQLRNTMGVPPDLEFELAPATFAQLPEAPSLSEALGEAKARRPEVAASQASVQERRRNLALARIARGPLMDVTGTWSQGYTNWNALDPTWDLLLDLSWPIFDGYSTRAGVIAAAASLTRAQADQQSVLNQVGLEVDQALVEVARTRERITASDKSVAAAEARMAAAEGKYQQGVGILIEVIDARVAVTSARADQVRARYDHQIALVGLQRAIGALQVPKEPAAGETATGP